jgi:hypothetical protein
MHFYVLARKAAAEYGTHWDAGFVAADPVEYGEAPRCPVCGRFTGMRRWLPPLRVELELHGREFGDVVTGFGSLLVSPRFEEIYRSSASTGLVGFEPLDIVRVRSRHRAVPEPPAYRRVEVAPSETAIDVGRTSVDRDGPIRCAHCLGGSIINGIRGVVIDTGTWGGEDWFEPRGLPGTIVVSARFHGVWREHGITNLKLVRAQDFVETFGLTEPA